MRFLLTTLKVVYVLTTPMPKLVEDATVEAIRIRPKWENDDYIYRGHILKGMSDSLFDVYTNVESAKEFWDSLESNHLRIEESLRAQDSDKGKGKEVGGPSVNMTEEGKNKHNKQNKGKKRSNENNSGSSSNKKPKLECWKCGKTGHFKRDCRSDKKNNANAGGSGKGSKDQSQDLGQNLVHVWNSFVKYCVSLISEAFYVQVDAIAWWIDSGATTHVCKDHCWFKTFEPAEDESVLYMGDEHFAPIHGKGSVALEFSSGKTVTLFNVLYVPKLHSVYMSSSSTVVNTSLCHARLKHVHYKRMLEMSKDDLILAIDENLENVLLGCRAVVRLPDPKRKTLGEKGIDCIFVGYAEHFNAYSIEEDPRTYNKAMQSRDDAFWKEAIDDEIGFRQKKEIDYFNTYAPVARITTIRLMLALTAIQNLVIHQMDVKTTFLNGDLDEEVYMKQPKGFVMSGNEHKIYLLRGGWVFLLGGGAISCASKKQTCITGLTMESEFIALDVAGKEAEWLKNSIHEILIWPKPIAPVYIRCDSAPTMARAYSQIYNGKSRHLGVRHSMVKELIRNGVISIEFVRTQYNLADHLTKGLARDLVQDLKGPPM
nr:zinc finger, CCHC-type [Tanacetum cinerariifolium]